MHKLYHYRSVYELKKVSVKHLLLEGNCGNNVLGHMNVCCVVTNSVLYSMMSNIALRPVQFAFNDRN